MLRCYNVAYETNCTRRAPELWTWVLQSYGTSSSSCPQNTPLPIHHSTCTPMSACSLRSHRIAVFVRKPGSSTDTSWNTYIAPFSSNLWLAVLCAMLVLTVALTLTFKIGLRIGIERSDGSARYSFQDSFLYVFGCICQQGL